MLTILNSISILDILQDMSAERLDVDRIVVEVQTNPKICVLCEIVAGRTPAGIILETSRLLVITAREDGYPLILPKAHIEDLRDPKLDDETAKELGLMQRDMAKIVTKIDMGVDISVVTNNGHQAGQEIPHLHIHIIPRTTGDRVVRIKFGTTLPLEERHLRAVRYRQALQDLQAP